MYSVSNKLRKNTIVVVAMVGSQLKELHTVSAVRIGRAVEPVDHEGEAWARFNYRRQEEQAEKEQAEQRAAAEAVADGDMLGDSPGGNWDESGAGAAAVGAASGEGPGTPQTSHPGTVWQYSSAAWELHKDMIAKVKESLKETSVHITAVFGTCYGNGLEDVIQAEAMKGLKESAGRVELFYIQEGTGPEGRALPADHMSWARRYDLQCANFINAADDTTTAKSLCEACVKAYGYSGRWKGGLGKVEYYRSLRWDYNSARKNEKKNEELGGRAIPIVSSLLDENDQVLEEQAGGGDGLSVQEVQDGNDVGALEDYDDRNYRTYWTESDDEGVSSF